MAINAYKQIWSYSSENAGTWSEVFYVQAANLEEALRVSPEFINKRLQMLHPVNYLEKIRTSEISGLRNSQPKRVNLPGLWNTGTPYPDSVACVMTLVSTAVKASRQWWMRGISHSFAYRVGATGRNIMTAEAQTAMNTFLQALQDRQYSILPKINPKLVGQLPNPVLQVDGNQNPGRAILTLQNPAAQIPGNIVILQRMPKKDLPGLNGKFKVLASQGFNVTIEYRTPRDEIFTQGLGTMADYSPNLGAVINKAASFFNFLGDHQTKNELTGSRGAKSAARVRSLR